MNEKGKESQEAGVIFGVINYGQNSSVFDIVNKIEKALNEVNTIYIVEGWDKCNGLNVCVGGNICFVNVNVNDRKVEKPEETFLRAAKEFEANRELLGWEREFLDYLLEKVFGDWKHYGSLSKGKNGTYVSVENYRTNELLKDFLKKKKVSSFFCQFVRSLDDIPCCDEYRILHFGYTYGYGEDGRWVGEFMLKSKEGKRREAEKIKNRIEERKIELQKTIREENQKNQRALERAKELEKEVLEM